MLLVTFCFILASTSALPYNLLPEASDLESINNLLTISASNVTSSLNVNETLTTVSAIFSNHICM